MVKVYVIVGVLQGCVNTVAVRSNEGEAKRARTAVRAEYGIVEQDGIPVRLDLSENDVQLFDAEVDGPDGDMVIE